MYPQKSEDSLLLYADPVVPRQPALTGSHTSHTIPNIRDKEHGPSGPTSKPRGLGRWLLVARSTSD